MGGLVRRYGWFEEEYSKEILEIGFRRSILVGIGDGGGVLDGVERDLRMKLENGVGLRYGGGVVVWGIVGIMILIGRRLKVV
jgi:hypothetical protein